MQGNAGLGSTTILNGFGISLGDGIIGLQALFAARSLGAIEGRVVLGRKEPPAKPLVPQIYRFAADFAEIVPMAEAPSTGRVIDIQDFAFDPFFRQVAMIDFFLTRLGLHPASVPASLKRMTWLASRAAPLPPLPFAPGYVLLCPRASIPLRDMPDAVHEALIDRVAARGWGPVMTQGLAQAGALTMPHCATVAELCAFVAGARAVISTDTAMVHLADAFSVPCLAFMTTHRPAMRVRDYPLCRAVHLPVGGLPDNLEFVRSEADIAAAQAAWFPEGDDLAWLDRALDQFASTTLCGR